MQNRVPTVLAVLVVKDGAAWVKRVLASLARQTHPRLGVLAVDCGSRDGSPEQLESVLGRRRVLRLRDNVSFPAAVQRALGIPAATEADYVLLVHDDTLLAPDCVAWLVEAARRADAMGVVGPKVLDWDGPRVLREIGFACDRFGYPSSPLEEGEIDQGQYDAAREVMFVSSAAMLVARDVWQRAGPPDERLATGRFELDFCWRIRMAGFRVMVAPAAVVLHRSATERFERPDPAPAGERYLTERAALLSLLKNYRLLSLAWVLPLYAVLGGTRLLLYLVSRRFDAGRQLLEAWGWNLARLPGTLSRRIRAQRARRSRDREVAAFMLGTGERLQRWALQASSLVGRRGSVRVEPDEEPDIAPLRTRMASLVAAHPVGVAWALAAVVTLIAFRGVLFVPEIEGGAFPAFPARAVEFFRAFAAPWHPAGFGGPGGGSPALVPLGAMSVATLGNPQLLARLLVALTPTLAGAACYTALRRSAVPPLPAVVGAVAYAASALTMWAASEGRIPVAALLVAVPWVWARLTTAFAPGGPARPLRWAVGTGIGLALAATFFPTVWTALGALLAALVVLPDRGGSRVRGVVLTVGAASVAAVLIFPLIATHLAAGAVPAEEATAVPSFSAFLRLSPGPAPGSSYAALFLPAAALLSFALVSEAGGRAAARALATAAAAIPAAWLAAAGHLPRPLQAPVPFLAVAALSLAVLVALGARALGAGVRRVAFGYRQVALTALGIVVAAGLALQSFHALAGRWAVGEARVPAAWPVVASADPDRAFRVLWLGPTGRGRFPPPGGDPDGVVAAGSDAVAYGVTDRAGRSILDVGLPRTGHGYRQLERVLAAVLTGRVRHGGALLAPLGIRFVVTGTDGIAPAPAEQLKGQVDLDLVQRAGGLSIYRSARPLPQALAISGRDAGAALRSPALLAPLSLDPDAARALAGGPRRGWSGRVEATGEEEGTDRPGGGGGNEGARETAVLVSAEFAPGWRLERLNGVDPPFPAFGWALGFEPRATGGTVRVTYAAGPAHVIQMVVLALAWAGALWLVRRRPRERPAHVRRLPAPEEERVPTPMGTA